MLGSSTSCFAKNTSVSGSTPDSTPRKTSPNHAEARVATDAEKRHVILESNQKLSTPTGCPIVKSKSGVAPRSL
jgi:hypothetical protein